MVLVSELPLPTFPEGDHVLNANSRNAFERNVADPVARERVSWKEKQYQGNQITFERKGAKEVDLKFYPAADWGHSNFADPYAHRIGAWKGNVGVSISGDGLRAIETEYLHDKRSRLDKVVTVRLDQDTLGLTFGTGKPVVFPAVSQGGQVRAAEVRVPSSELAKVLEIAIAQGQGELLFHADPAGVLSIGFEGLSASGLSTLHSVFISGVTAAGARDSGSVFQRYTKADFAPVDQKEAA